MRQTLNLKHWLNSEFAKIKGALAVIIGILLDNRFVWLFVFLYLLFTFSVWASHKAHIKREAPELDEMP